jgi:cell division protein FtsW (lipid II flippase)
LPQCDSKITGYLETVREQIRWKRAQAPVLQEIANHIADQKNALLSAGLAEETATDGALAEMGDPVVVGEALNRAHRPKPDWPLLALTAVLLCLGLFFQFLIGPDIDNGTAMFGKQVIWSGLGVLALLTAYFCDYTILGKYPKLIYWGLCGLTAANYLLTATSRFTTIYLLLLVPAAFAGFVYSMRQKGYAGLLFCGGALLVPVGLAVALPSLTGLFLLVASCLVMLTAAVIKGWFCIRKSAALLLIYLPAVAVVWATPFLLLLSGRDYVWARIRVVLNPGLDPTGTSYGYVGTVIRRLLLQSRLAGEGMPVSGYGSEPVSRILPAANTDFLLTYLTHRFGWLILIGILTLLCIFIVRALLVCRKQKSVLGFLVSLAVIATFTLQWLTGVAANLGFLLFTPVSIPLFSYGGRGLLVNMLLIGFLLSVFRTGNLAGEQLKATPAGSGRFIQYENGRIIINLKSNS